MVLRFCAVVVLTWLLSTVIAWVQSWIKLSNLFFIWSGARFLFFLSPSKFLLTFEIVTMEFKRFPCNSCDCWFLGSRFLDSWNFKNYITNNIFSFSVSKISFINLVTSIDFNNDQNSMHRIKTWNGLIYTDISEFGG